MRSMIMFTLELRRSAPIPICHPSFAGLKGVAWPQ